MPHELPDELVGVAELTGQIIIRMNAEKKHMAESYVRLMFNRLDNEFHWTDAEAERAERIRNALLAEIGRAVDVEVAPR